MGRVGSIESYVGAAPETVFAVITDPAELPKWNRHIARTLDHPTHLEEGAEWVVQMDIYGQKFPSRSRVLTLDAEAGRFEYQSSPDGDPDFAIWSWEVAPDGSGSRVRVTWDLNPKLFLMRMLWSPLRARGLPKDVAASLTSLEKFVTTLEHVR